MNKRVSLNGIMISFLMMCFITSCSQESPQGAGSVQEPIAVQAPEPEFFGVYLIDGKELHGLTPGNLEADGPRFTATSRIIIFLADPTQVTAQPGGLLMNDKGIIRQDVELFQQTDTVQTVTLHETNDKAVVFEQSYPLQLKPGTKAGSFEAVSLSPLPEGRYVFNLHGEYYPLHVKNAGQELPVYDRYYETISENNVFDALDAASSRGMLSRKTIGDHFITNETYKSTKVLGERLEAQRKEAIQRFETKEFPEAYFLAKASLVHFNDNQALEEIIQKAPILAMDLREENEEWEGITRWTNAWVKETGNRADVVKRAKELIEREKIVTFEAITATGNVNEFLRKLHQIKSAGLSANMEQSLEDLLIQCKRLSYLSAVQLAEEEDPVTALKHFEGASGVASTETDAETAKVLFKKMYSKNPYGLHFLKRKYGWNLSDMKGESVSFSLDSSDFWIHRKYQSPPLLNLSVTGGVKKYSYPKGFQPDQISLSTGISYRTRERYENGRMITILESADPDGRTIKTVKFVDPLGAVLNPTGELFVLYYKNRNPSGPQYFLTKKTKEARHDQVKLPFSRLTDTNGRVLDQRVINIFLDQKGTYVAVASRYQVAMYEVEGWKLKWTAKINDIGYPIGISNDGMVIHFTNHSGGIAAGDWVIYDHRSGKSKKIQHTGNSIKKYSNDNNIGIVASARDIQFLDLNSGVVIGSIAVSDLVGDLQRGDGIKDLDISPDGQYITLMLHSGLVYLFEKQDLSFEAYWSEVVKKQDESEWLLGTWEVEEREVNTSKFKTHMNFYGDGQVISWKNNRYYTGNWELDKGHVVVYFGQNGRAVSKGTSKNTLVFDFDNEEVQYVRPQIQKTSSKQENLQTKETFPIQDTISNGRSIYVCVFSQLSIPMPLPIPKSVDFTTSNQWFVSLISSDIMNVDWSFFSGPGKKKASGKFIPSDPNSINEFDESSNYWSVVADVDIEDFASVPFLISYNLDETQLKNPKITSEPPKLKQGPHGDYIVVVRMGGSVEVIDKKDLTWEALNPHGYQNSILHPGTPTRDDQ